MKTSTRTRFNWAPVIMSLCNTLQKQGFTLSYSDNGEFKTVVPKGASLAFARRLITYNADACDEVSIYAKSPIDGKNKWIFIVLGNDPDELMSDYTACEELDNVLEAHGKIWEGKKCPTLPADAPYKTKEPTQ